MKYCIHCGKKISKNTQFCPYCGTKQYTKQQLNGNDKTTTKTDTDDLNTNENSVPSPNNSNKPHKFWKKLIVPVAVIAIFIGFFALITSQFKGSSNGGASAKQVVNAVVNINNKTQSGSETQDHSFSKCSYDGGILTLTANSDIASAIPRALHGNPSNNGGTEEQDLESTDSLLNAMDRIQKKVDKMTGQHVSLKVSNSSLANEIYKNPSKYKSKILFGKEYPEFIKGHKANPNAESNNPSAKDVIASNNMQGNYNNPYYTSLS